MLEFERELWKIDAETGWTSEEVQAPDGELQRMKKFLREILAVFHRYHPELVSSYVALSGLDEEFGGWFRPIGAFNCDSDAILPTPTADELTPIGRALGGPEAIVRLGPEGSSPARSPSKLLIKIEAHGEFFGFICLVGSEVEEFSEERYHAIWEALPVLSRTIGDAIFSMRLRTLAGPFVPHNGCDPLQGLLKEIVKRTALGFAADGAVLRLFDRQSGLLKVREWCGEIDPQLLEDVLTGVGLTGRVFAEPGHSWALSMPPDLNVPYITDTTIHGLEVPDEDKRHGVDAGLSSYIVMRLASEVAPASPHRTGLGTLSFFHRRPHRFSWREIAAFRSYCQRVAETISLHLTNERLEENIEKLRLQNLALTRVEIVALLAHDLSHKAFSACKDVDEYIRRCRKSMNDRKVQVDHSHLEAYAARALESTLGVQSAIDRIRSLYKAGPTESEPEAEFELHEVVDDIRELMAGALERNKIGIDASYRGNLRIRGPKSVLSQALSNLVINSIDAFRSRRTQRSLYIHIHASLEQQGGKGDYGKARRVVIQYWDDGPGIDRQMYPDPQKIFEFGVTTRPEGTGTGLPVARSLLGRYFDAQLVLEDRTCARFKITIPVR
jgi:signal transduction histidine kinase